MEECSVYIIFSMYSVQPNGYMGYPQEPAYSANNTTKKIQNYTFKLNEVLGKGNFSKVYRGLNEITSKDETTQTSPWLLK